MEKKIFTVNGMKCEHCKMSVENAIKGINGVSSAEVSLKNKNVTVEYDAAKVSPDQMKEAVETAGNFEMVL
jgi:copper chaperone